MTVKVTSMVRRFVITALSCCLVLVLLSTDSSAQRKKILNLPKYDRQAFHFGFLLGINKTDFEVRRMEDFNFNDSLYTVEPQGLSGFNLQIVTNMRLGEHFDLRFLPGLSFASRNLVYTFEQGRPRNNVVTKKIESTFVEFPVDLKFKSARLNNFRAYVLGGVKYSIDMVSQAKVAAKDKEFVKLQKQDYGYEIGIGCDFYMPMFKFSPEIKMYHGLRNLLVKDDLVYSQSLNGLFSKVFTLSLTFE